MTDILDEIIAHKRLEIEQQKAAISPVSYTHLTLPTKLEV